MISSEKEIIFNKTGFRLKLRSGVEITRNEIIITDEYCGHSVGERGDIKNPERAKNPNSPCDYCGNPIGKSPFVSYDPDAAGIYCSEDCSGQAHLEAFF
jgi:hypothetical protein